MSQNEATNPKKKVKRDIIEETESSIDDDENSSSSGEEFSHECCDCGNDEICPHQCEECNQQMCTGCKETTEQMWIGVGDQEGIYCGECHIAVATRQWTDLLNKGGVDQIRFDERIKELETLFAEKYQ